MFAIIGFIGILLFGIWLGWNGIGINLVSLGFTGKYHGIGVVLFLVGTAIIVADFYYAPFSLSLVMK